MSVAKWLLGTEGSDVASTKLDSLANGSSTAAIDFDPTANNYFYARVEVQLGSITPGTGGSITLLAYNSGHSAGVEDLNGAPADQYTLALKSGASAKKVIFPLVRTYPWDMNFVVVNNSGVSFAASGNHVYITPFTEQVV